ncbi:hypothetical protein CFBP3846_04328 [Pseudomonas syringae pv. avii]|uniref:Secreted protein n=2 Tax=Pseudomonas syringae group TaxID=136849 RepID=A0ABY1UBZ5_PSESX|nr:hypothetical protein CFBP1573P_04333 [Pseudomonas syringae pv. persicae]SOQ13135.1 hypothetical protein NCPPB2254_04264 [Pseudomonas syringae pv. persicae]SOS28722.1 hypothetical protein CFBP3846_04328 [Pseudomonas syringae pv. avii]
MTCVHCIFAAVIVVMRSITRFEYGLRKTWKSQIR